MPQDCSKINAQEGRKALHAIVNKLDELIQALRR